MHDLYLTVSELFYSIQGESTRSGLPCAFIRLSGCNLRCTYCDSSYTWEEEGQQVPLDGILQWLDDYPGVMVELTGGEPLLQENVYSLLDKLIADRRSVLLETNGSVRIDKVPYEIGIILDVKCPDSGMVDRTDMENIHILGNRKRNHSQDEIKFVLSSEQDYQWAKAMIIREDLAELAPLLFSPVEESFSPAKLAELMLADRMKARLQVQLHRIIWPDLDRGV